MEIGGDRSAMMLPRSRPSITWIVTNAIGGLDYPLAMAISVMMMTMMAGLLYLGHRLFDLTKILEPIIQLFKADLRSHPHQLSITPEHTVSLSNLRETISDALFRQMPPLRVVESDHSVDVLGTQATKLAVLQAVHNQISARSSGAEILKMGDQGHLRGNDFELLREGFSLSVDKVSSDLEACWNLGKAGGKGVSITLEYLRALTCVEGEYFLDTSKLLS